MSLFTDFFDVLVGKDSRHSSVQKFLSRRDICKIVSRNKIISLSLEEEKLVEEAIIKRRKGDGKISMQQVEEMLINLKNERKISETDYKALIKLFLDYFAK